MMLGVVEGGTGAPRSRPDGMWRQHDFLTLWLGQTGSVVGSQVTLLALPLTADRCPAPARDGAADGAAGCGRDRAVRAL